MQPGEVTDGEFRKLLRWTGRLFNVMTMSDAVAGLRGGTLPSRPLVITFDDGYADNEQLAAPALQELGMPATFFVATGYLDGGLMFNDAVISALGSTKLRQLDLTEIGLGHHSLGSADDRRQTIARLLVVVKGLASEQRVAAADRICELAEVEPPSDLMMKSSQVADLAQRGFEIGAHTVSHPLLATVGESAARQEIQHSRTRLEQICCAPIRFFAYPNGRPADDYSIETVRLVKELGFDAAFTTARGTAAANADLFQLPRFTPWDRTEFRFGMRLMLNLMRRQLTLA